MIYMYYMKIRTSLLAFFVTLPLLAQAQLTVVRVQAQKIYLDTSASSTAVKKGDTFKVILSSEKLTNPKTGKELGLIHNYSPEGTITEVQPLYAIGQLPSVKGVEVGQEAVLEAKAIPAAPAVKNTTAKTEDNAPLHQKISYNPVGQEIISLTSGAFIAPGANNIITLSDKGLITVWERDGESLKEITAYPIPATKKPLTISAAPVRGQQTAEMFAAIYDEALARISTVVLAYENGQWIMLDTLPYFVKETGCGNHKTIWMQRPFVLGARPGNARDLIYKDGKFVTGEKTIATQHNWLTGMNFYPAQDEENLVYTTSVGRIKMLLPNNKTTEYKDFAVGAPNRVKYKQDILKFYPALQVVNSRGLTQVVAAENTAKLGILSKTFGDYESGKIHFLSFEKGRFVNTDTVPLDGFVYDTACTDSGVLSAEVLTDGQSALVEILN